MKKDDNVSNDGWSEYGRLVLNELKRLNQGQEDLKKDLDDKFSILNEKISSFNNLEKEVEELREWKEAVMEVWSPKQMQQGKDEIYRQKGYYQRVIGILIVLQTLLTLFGIFKDKLF